MLWRTMTGAANELLKATARSFYLTLRVLPEPVRAQIGLAYLLARTTDTVADTEIVPVAERLAALRRLRERITGQSAAALDFGELAQWQGAPAEKRLLEKAEDSMAALEALTAPDRTLVREVLVTITSGQELDVKRFAGASESRVAALETAADLDDYTYRVAGCVGEFWTKICRARLFPGAGLDEPQLQADGIRFGKGLQLVNILRDLPADLKIGRCYLPRQTLAGAGLAPEEILRPDREEAFLRVFRAQLDLAEGHLAAGWRYTNALPFSQFRVRLACAWPLLVGVKTLRRLRAAGIADLQRRVKVPRSEVYGVMASTTLACGVPFWWRRLYLPDAKAVASGGKLA